MTNAHLVFSVINGAMTVAESFQSDVAAIQRVHELYDCDPSTYHGILTVSTLQPDWPPEPTAELYQDFSL